MSQTQKVTEEIFTQPGNKWFKVVKRNGFYFAERTSPHIVQVLGINDDGDVPMVRQWREAARMTVDELPAGIDDKHLDTDQDERLKQTALEELEEEVGYSASRITEIWQGPKSAGLCNEIMHVFIASMLNKSGEGGGVGRENIDVFHVPFHDMPQYVLDSQTCGIGVLNAHALAVAAAKAGSLDEDLTSFILKEG